MSDSSSSTPMVLTPDSTGSPDAVSVKKQRRQTAFYPNMNSSNKQQNPFSRSAAKRESVMTLGSIEHLQHYFTKTGIAAKKSSLDKHKGLVPAIGGLSHVRGNPSLGGIADLPLPPSPAVPSISRPTFPPYIKTYETNPESLLPGVLDDLTAVSRVWCIDQTPTVDRHNPDLLSAPTSSSSTRLSNFDVLYNLKATTRAIRSVRNYLLSLPDESTDISHAPTQFRPRTLTPAASKRIVSQPNVSTDPLSMIRRAALEVLTVLRDLEDKSRLPLSDDAYDAQSDHGSASSQGQASGQSRVASPFVEPHSPLQEQEFGDVHEVDNDTSVAFSVIKVHGRHESVLVWEDEDPADVLNGWNEEEKKERWDERLVLGSGWLYKQDIQLEDLGRESEVVRKYLDTVDDALFSGTKEGKRGWERERERVEKRKKEKEKSKRISAEDLDGHLTEAGSRKSRRVVSSGILEDMRHMAVTDEPEEMESVSEEDSVDDDELPMWAKRSSFPDDLLGRAHMVIVTFLPSHLLPHLPAPSNRFTFLHALSSGQLLCLAYNPCVRKSTKPWGYISKDAVHDILALEEAQAAGKYEDKENGKGKKGWTFRRTDNLRLWAAAVKLRYLIPIVSSIPKSNTPSGKPVVSPLSPSSSSRNNEPPIIFDAPVVARKEEGWEDMLERLLLRWIEVVVEEKRGVR